MDEEEKKWRAKQALLSKLKDLDTLKQQKAEPAPPFQHQTRNPMPKMEPSHKGAMRIDTEEDFKKMPYEGKAKYDNELKALNALKSDNPEIVQKPKKMFFEHYDTSEPYCPNIPNNPNPSGRPPNIPPEMYQGITVKPKRPWVYLGTENLPPVEYQEINDRNFKQIQRRHFEDKKEVQKPKGQPKKKKAKKEEEEGSDEFNSNFEMSDEMEMSGQSMLVSDYKSQSKQSKSKGGPSKMGKQSSVFAYEDDEIISEGVETKKRMGNMFEDMDDSESDDMEMEDESSQVKSKKPGKKEVKKSKGASKQSQSQVQDDSD